MQGWSALILGGGAGRRFGGDKLVADLAGGPVIRRVAERVAQAEFAEVVVVTGAQDAVMRPALAGLGLRLVHARDWAEGMAASLRAGIAALAPQASGVCVFLGDMPLVPVGLAPALCAAAERAGFAARLRCAGRPGHPVALTRAAFADLMALRGDRGASALLHRRGATVAYCDIDDGGALLDIDTPADLAAAACAWKACATSATSESATSRGALPKP